VAQWVYSPIALLGVGLAGVAWICAGFSMAMLAATLYLGRAFERRRKPTAASEPTS